MRKDHLVSAGLAAIAVCMLLSSEVAAQTRRAQAQVAALPEQKCLRALDGSCTDPGLVEAARQRAIIVPSVRVSYFGTPAGTIGGEYIPYERLFRDNPVVFGLPVNTFFCCNAFRRSQ